MTTEERHDEIRRLEGRLALVRRGFLRIAEALHEANDMLLWTELPVELDRLNGERKSLATQYRQIVGRLQFLKAA